MLGDREKALEAGMDDYISKPVNSEELEATLKYWITRPDEALLVSEGGTRSEAPPEVSVDPLDRSALQSLRELQEEGEPDLLKQLIELFLKETPSQLAALREAVQRGDAQSTDQVAHALKGCCLSMGAVRLASACTELQKAGARGDLAGAPEILHRLEVEFARARTALEAEASNN